MSRTERGPGDTVRFPDRPATARAQAIVVGGSAGGMEALCAMLTPLPVDFLLPILVVNHLHPSDDGRFAEHLAAMLHLPVCEARDKQPIVRPGVYVAPANYHLLVEQDETLSLSIDPKVNWARPSIDVLFESAARVWRETLIGVVLSGANHDGAEGARVIRSLGGLALAQEPATAVQPVMPQAAIARAGIDVVLSPVEIGRRLLAECGIVRNAERGTRNAERGMRNAERGTRNAE